MQVVVVGGGAIGMLVAGSLAQAGTPPALLTRARSIAAITKESLQIDVAGEIKHIHDLILADTPAALPATHHQPDLAILCVKGYDTPEAIETLRVLEPRQVLTLQNGIGNEEQLSAALGGTAIISGAITTSVDLVDLHTIAVTKVGGIGIAACDPYGSPAPVAAILEQAGFRVARYDDYRAMKWSKALLNMLGNASSAILDLPVDQVYADRRMIAIECRIIRESLAVMRQMRIQPLNLPRYPAALLARAITWLPAPILFPVLRGKVAGGRGGKDPSLLRDLRSGRTRSEGELLYGAVAREAARQGLKAPVNATIWNILSGIATGQIDWDEYRGKPEVLLQAINSRRAARVPPAR
jgi:2-dehydropantoate 2-reductase